MTKRLVSSILLLLGLFLLLSVGSAVASSPLLYDQPLVVDGDRGPYSGAFTGVHSADEFVLANDSSIDQVEWNGSFVDGSNNDAPLTAAPGTFRIQFFPSSAADPTIPGGVPVFTEFATATITGSTLNNLSQTIYSFSSDLSTSFIASAGTSYWLSIVRINHPSTGAFRWQPSQVVPGDSGFQKFGDGQPWNSLPANQSNLAFQLHGNVIPPTPISVCSTLNSPGTTYVLTQSFTWPTHSCFLIEADNVTLDGNGFTVTGGGYGKAVKVYGRTGVTVKNLGIDKFDIGIDVRSSVNNDFTGNIITDVGNKGIQLFSYGGQGSDSNTLSNNVTSGGNYGIFFTGSSNNLISGNTTEGNINAGFGVESGSNNNTFSGNTVDSNRRGLSLWFNVTGNDVKENTISGNDTGIDLNGSSANNRIFNNNFFSNVTQAKDDGTGNVFSLAGPVGGNYWNDYDEIGEGCEDVSPSDGFCDLPYPFLFAGGQDALPWTSIIPGTPPRPATDNANVTVERKPSGQFTINVTDPDGIGEFLVSSATGTSIYGGSPACSFTNLTSGWVSLTSADFPLHAVLGPDCGSPTNVEEFDLDEPPAVADLEISKWGPASGTAIVGELFTYTMQITNRGPHNANNVVVTDQLHSSLTVESMGGPNCVHTVATNTVECTQGVTLAPNHQFYVDIQVRSNQVGLVDNTALVASGESDPGAFSNISNVVLEILPDNAPPTADAGGDQEVEQGSQVSLDGRASDDPDEEDTLTYSWAFVYVPAGSEWEGFLPNNPTRDRSSFRADKIGEYKVSLTVNDGTVDSEPAYAIITVIAANRDPIADAGLSQEFELGGQFDLDGSGSSDPDGDDLTYSWYFFEVPDGSGAVLSDDDTVSPSFTPDLIGDYIVVLDVEDGRGGDDTGFIVVTVVNPNLPPTADAGEDRDVEVLIRVKLDGSDSDDPDEGDTLTYAWVFSSIPANSGSVLNNPGTVTPSFTPDIIGEYLIHLTVDDGDGGIDFDTIAVQAEDTTPPSIVQPANITVEADVEGGWTEALVVPFVTDAVGPITITHNAPAVLPVGVATVVIWTAKDGANNESTANQTVTVEDTTAPTLVNVPAGPTEEATSEDGALVSLAAPTADDIADPSPVVTGSRSDGLPLSSPYPLGATTVTWTATDASSNSAEAETVVTVEDTTAPTLVNVPAGPTEEATSEDGAPVNLAAPTADDIADPSPVVTGSRSDGLPLSSPYPLGATTVAWTGTDASSNSVEAETVVTVEDTTAPTLVNVPGDITVIATGDDGALASLTPPTADDIADPSPVVTGIRSDGEPLGALYPIGETTVTWTGTDASTNSVEAITVVTVINSARFLKQKAIEELTPFDGESKRIDKAIKAIIKSLEKGWIDETHLEEKDGKKVFDEEKRASRELERILKDAGKGKGKETPGAVAVSQTALDYLIAADALLAETALEDARAARDALLGSDPKKAAKVTKEIEHAEKELAKVQSELDRGHYNHAINKYKKTWEHALKAIKAAK